MFQDMSPEMLPMEPGGWAGPEVWAPGWGGRWVSTGGSGGWGCGGGQGCR